MTPARITPAVVDDWARLRALARGYLLTALAPRRREAEATARFVERRLARQPWLRARIRGRMEQVLGERRLLELDLDAAALDYCRRTLEEEWGHWRALHRRGWQVDTEVDGLHRIEAARARGGGTILWGMSFCGDLVAKIGLHRAGVALVHLSAADHGAHYPPSALGLQVVGPFYCRAENRYLAERVVIPASGALGYLRVLKARLAERRCVWIAGERAADRGNVTGRIFGRPLQVATGAPSLAWSTGAALLPVDVVREAPLRYRVRVDEPIEPLRVDKASFVEAAVVEFVRRLEARVVEHPADWSWEVHTISQLLRHDETVKRGRGADAGTS